MDVRNVRVLRAYEDVKSDVPVIYIDESAREYLGKISWETEVDVIGRRRTSAIIKPLREIDWDGQIARVEDSLREDLMVEWGEEVLIVKK
jgi:hypothetical protein